MIEDFNSFIETHDKISFSQQERDRLKRTPFEVETTKRQRCKTYSTPLIKIPLSLSSKCLQLSLPVKS